MQIFGLKIKELREKNGISQKELANGINVSTKSIINWENNIVQPKNALTTLKKISVFFNVDASYILGLK